ncbi:MAG: hypothetical protein B6D35_13605 [Candidatus Brocadia sp. UTAMX2]|jgi:tRNA A-37 threonylcarbamoyl transferase component Bud32|nr:MAG: hypothetical protein B6D35_13605 [Candidatus Brocadia sp. UTAMX2]
MLTNHASPETITLMLTKSMTLPAFSLLKQGNTTLLVKDQYRELLFNMVFHPETFEDKRKTSGTVKYGRGAYRTIPLSGNSRERLIIRNYRHGGLFGKLLGGIFYNENRPVNEVAINEIALQKDVLSAEVVAVIKRRLWGLFYTADFISREIPDAVDLIQLITESSGTFIQKFKRPVIRAIAGLLRNMHDAGIFHADLHLKNILVKHDSTGEFHAYIIDLDKSVVTEKLNIDKRMKNLLRLDRSVEKLRWLSGRTNTSLHQKMGFISRTDKIRFFRSYLLWGNALDKDWKKYLRQSHSRHAIHKLWWRIPRFF